jgi:glycosyltransferase involved in cell wall biosynthesis
LQKNLRALIERLRLSTSVGIESVGAEQRERIFAASDVFALNTAYEGFPHAILEAMASGLPVVTTDAGGNSELMQDGVNGFLFRYDDAEALTRLLVMLARDGAMRKRIAGEGRKTASQFTVEKMVSETIKTLSSV